jgi:hypothetical protein
LIERALHFDKSFLFFHFFFCRSYAALVKEQAVQSKNVRKERDAKLADLEKYARLLLLLHNVILKRFFLFVAGIVPKFVREHLLQYV